MAPVAVALVAATAHAIEIKRQPLSNGTVIEYALVLPEPFDRSRTYPALLAFPGGRQSIRTARGALRRYWGAEGARRGFIVVSPAAPNGVSFIDGSERLVPEFAGHFLAQYRVVDGKFHVAGNSNGGKSAFRVAILYPELFHSITVLAGFPPEYRNASRLRRLRGIRINMFVGEGDPAWRDPMLETRRLLEALGLDVYFVSLPRNGHFLPDLSFENSGKIFDRILP